jgi:uncharacterized protein YchJ
VALVVVLVAPMVPIHALILMCGSNSKLGLEVGLTQKDENKNGTVSKEIKFRTQSDHRDLPNRSTMVENNQISIYVDAGIF